MKRRSEALPAEQRITKKKDFERIRRTGMWIRGENFDVILAGATGERTRFGLIVPLYSHHVVERNLLKRRMREIMRREITPRTVKPYDIVVRARKEAYSSDFPSMKQELEELTKQVTGKRADNGS